MIPASRLDPSAQKIMDFFYPLPNAGTLSNGYGRYRQFVPETRKRAARRPADRPRAELEGLALPPRELPAPRPRARSRFEAGNALTNLPILDSKLNTAAVIGGWTKILSPTVVNELRVGYNYDNSQRQSNFIAEDVSDQLGLETAPSLVGHEPARLPVLPVHRLEPARRTSRTPAGTWTAPCTQNAFSISDNMTFVVGSHSLRVGGALEPQHGP